MKVKSINWKRIALFAVLALSFSMVSCTRYPTEEELNQLDLQIEAADRAEARVAELENEKAKLQRELAAAKQELADHEAEFEEIKRRTSAK
jgi:septal ring factor EnvC (AmiA/AmiB activator)